MKVDIDSLHNTDIKQHKAEKTTREYSLDYFVCFVNNSFEAPLRTLHH